MPATRNLEHLRLDFRLQWVVVHVLARKFGCPPVVGGSRQHIHCNMYQAVSALAVAAVFALACGCNLENAAPGTRYSSQLWIREFCVPAAGGSSLTVFVRNKYATASTSSSSAAPSSGVGVANRTVLLIAGATYPTSTSLDLALDGVSFADYLALSGYDVWLLDQRGYGRSDRPVEMSMPAADNAPICNTSTVAGDVGAVVDFIMAQRGISSVALLGWSWGTSIMALYASTHASLVNKLVLYAPQWVRPPVAAPVGAYRTVTQVAAMARWLNGVPSYAVAGLIPGDWAAVWWNATVALDPVGASAVPPVVRAPNGIVQDNHDYWGAGIPLYDPAALTMPVLLAHAEWDADLPSWMTAGIWANLTRCANKRWVELAQGTHTVVMEKNRLQLMRAVVAFLDEPNPIALVPQPGPGVPIATTINPSGGGMGAGIAAAGSLSCAGSMPSSSSASGAAGASAAAGTNCDYVAVDFRGAPLTAALTAAQAQLAAANAEASSLRSHAAAATAAAAIFGVAAAIMAGALACMALRGRLGSGFTASMGRSTSTRPLSASRSATPPPVSNPAFGLTSPAGSAAAAASGAAGSTGTVPAVPLSA